MNKTLIIFVALLALAAAVPVNPQLPEGETTTAAGAVICAPTTPCAWSIYNYSTKEEIGPKVLNTYCICDSETKCVFVEDDQTSTSYVFKCRNSPENTDSEIL